MVTQSAKNAAKLTFSVDLKAAALRHLNFLIAVERHRRLYQDTDIVRQAVYRYQHFWLPLVVRHKQKTLQAPLDIAWVWHCHMLCPVAYCEDTTRLFGEVVTNTSLDRSESERYELLRETAALWHDAYPNDPFLADITVSGQAQQKYVSGKTDFSYDIVAAALRQKEFGYQVRLPHYKDKQILDKALLRYKKFIYLKSIKPWLFLVPCYDIDLMWHTHQLYPQLYVEDMERILGHLFNHDDTVTDRSEGSKLSRSDLVTRQVWQEEYNEYFSDFGVMYRGPNPAGKLDAMAKKDILSISTRSAYIFFKKIRVIPNFSLEGKPRIKFFTTVNSKEATAIGSLKGLEKNWLEGPFPFCNFETCSVNCVMFVLQEVFGFGCIMSKTDEAKSTFNMVPIVESIPVGEIKTVEKSISTDQLQVYFEVRVGPVKEGPILLYLYSGPYESCAMSANLESVWGSVPFVRLPPGANYTYEMAIHRLMNHRREVVFTCRLLHSVSLLQSAIQVFYKSSMVAMAHLIGTDTIPLATEVADQSSCITLNPKGGERAVLIKNHEGDWGIVVGRWIGCKIGVAGSYNMRGILGSPGTLLVKVRYLSNNHTTELKLPYLSKHYAFELLGMKVNLKTGSIMIHKACKDVAENLALVFSISLLHVLCQPRIAGWRPGQTNKPIISTRGNKQVSTVPSEDMAFVMASGFLANTPSNHFVREVYGANVCVVCGAGGHVRSDDLTRVNTGYLEDGEVIGTFKYDDGGAGCGGCGGCSGGVGNAGQLILPPPACIGGFGGPC